MLQLNTWAGVERNQIILLRMHHFKHFRPVDYRHTRKAHVGMDSQRVVLSIFVTSLSKAYWEERKRETVSGPKQYSMSGILPLAERNGD